MQYLSTRGADAGHTLGAAISAGLASDGGLFVPHTLPRFELAQFDRADTPAAIAEVLLRPFCDGDPALTEALPQICAEAFSFPIPVTRHGDYSVLELFHGPTAAFKDVGAQFLAACVQRLESSTTSPLTILVATSGDTGGAVAAAFHRRPGTEVVVLYPAGMVSPRQERQLTCWGDNVRSFRVDGVFDDCQRLVKAAFEDPELCAARRLSSANSINIGRLLPQAAYYAAASLWHWREHATPVSIVVPTGNLGNGLAAVWAREMGLPIGRIVLATNANRVIPEFLASGAWTPRATIATLASAMDVGNPSNMERLRWLFPDFADLCAAVDAATVTDEEIRACIREQYERHGKLWCPHTATAIQVYCQMGSAQRRASDWLLVATAHPAKFETVIEPLINAPVPVPETLRVLLDLPSHVEDLSADSESLRNALLR